MGDFMNEKTGGRVNYYLAPVDHPQRETQAPYVAECEDIIQALGMTFDEGCEFKAIWRTAAARLGNVKSGHDAIYDAEKRVHYAGRSLKFERIKAAEVTQPSMPPALPATKENILAKAAILAKFPKSAKDYPPDEPEWPRVYGSIDNLDWVVAEFKGQPIQCFSDLSKSEQLAVLNILKHRKEWQELSDAEREPTTTCFGKSHGDLTENERGIITNKLAGF